MDGEFFQGQLNGCKNEFLDLIKFIYEQNINEVWIAATLIDKNQDDLFETLQLCSKSKRTIICTSYDTIGRFHNNDQLNQWKINVCKIKELGFDVHVTSIITQDFINKLLMSSNWLEDISKYATVDFRFPTIYWWDLQIVKNNGINKDVYRQMLLKNIHYFPENWYIKNRNELFKCLNIIKNLYGSEKLYWLQSNEVRSDKLYFLSPNVTLNNRWSAENNEENAPCGHPWTNYCYENDDRCLQCDVLNFYKSL